MIIKAHPSQLRLLNFYVELLHVEWVEDLDVEEDDIIARQIDYELEFDFEVKDSPDDPAEFLFEMTAWVNAGAEQLPGYDIEISGFGIFLLEGMDQLSEAEINSLKLISATSFMIGSIRTALWNATSMGPVGGYTLPPIDLNALLEAKIKGSPKKATPKKGNANTKKGFKGIVR